MSRRKSIAAATAIFAAAAAGCDGRAVHVDENKKRLNGNRQAGTNVDGRELNARLHNRGKQNIRKSNADRIRRQTDTTTNSGIAEYETMAQFEPIYQAHHYVEPVAIDSKSGKAIGKSSKEEHHHARPPQHVQQPPPGLPKI